MTLISEVMTRDVRTLSPDESVTHAAQVMDELDVGVIPVCEGDELVGVVTDRDIVLRGVAQGLEPDSTPLAEVMSEDICTCYDDEDVDEVVDRMRQEQIRRVPVLNRSDRLVGIVSLGDIAVKESDVTAGIALEEISEPSKSR